MTGLSILPIGFYFIVTPLLPTRQNTWLIPHIKTCVLTLLSPQNGNGGLCRYPSYSMEAFICHAVGIDFHGRGENGRLYQKRRGMVWGLPSHDATHVRKICMSETIGVTRKDDVWCWASDLMVVAEVVCAINSACVFIWTPYPC
jgi:hypothetical protein